MIVTGFFSGLASKMYMLEFDPFTQTWADPVVENDTRVADVTAKLQATAL